MFCFEMPWNFLKYLHILIYVFALVFLKRVLYSFALFCLKLALDAISLFLYVYIQYPAVFEKIKPEESKVTVLKEKLALLETIMKGPYMLGDKLTIADFSVLVTVTTLEVG